MYSRLVCSLLLALALTASARGLCAETPTAASTPSESTSAKVTVQSKGEKVATVLNALATQSGKTLIVESTATSKIDADLKQVDFELALDAICQTARLVWRKLYLEKDSKLISDPDRLSATARLLAGIGFPQIMVASTSSGSPVVYAADKTAVGAMRPAFSADKAEVYLVSNDAGAFAAAEERGKPKPVDDFMNLAKQQIDTFMKMSPEDREQALMASLNMIDEMGSGYQTAVMQSLMRTNPDRLKQMVSRQTQLLFNMSQDDRRAMLRLNMQIANMMTPEQKQLLQEDAQAVAEEMKDAPGN